MNTVQAKNQSGLEIGNSLVIITKKIQEECIFTVLGVDWSAAF